jgi:Pretoxin HINT domain
VLGTFMNCLDDHNSTSACLNVVANPLYGTVASFGNCLDGGSSAYQCANQGFNPAYQLLVHGDRCITGETVLTGSMSRTTACGLAVLDTANTVATAVGGARALTNGIEARAGTAAAEAESGALSCSVNSFTGATLVLLASGEKVPISTIKVGDMVIAADPATGKTGARRVTKLIVHGGKHTMVNVTLHDGSTITATDHHPFWNNSSRKFTYAIDLRPGDRLVEPDGAQLQVDSVVVHDEDLTAYNLAIDDIHTYYAGTTPVLVHNTCGATNTGASNAANGVRLNEQLTADEISSGHAFDKHVLVQGEFPGITTRSQFAQRIESAIRNGEAKSLTGGRTAWWDPGSGTVVIRNPGAVDGGTAFVPTNGRAYFDGLR